MSQVNRPITITEMMTALPDEVRSKLADYEKVKRTLDYQTNELENTKERVRKLKAEVERLNDRHKIEMKDITVTVTDTSGLPMTFTVSWDADLDEWGQKIRLILTFLQFSVDEVVINPESDDPQAREKP